MKKAVSHSQPKRAGIKTALCLFLAAGILLSSAACGSSQSSTSAAGSAAGNSTAAASASSLVTIGMSSDAADLDPVNAKDNADI